MFFSCIFRQNNNGKGTDFRKVFPSYQDASPHEEFLHLLQTKNVLRGTQADKVT